MKKSLLLLPVLLVAALALSACGGGGSSSSGSGEEGAIETAIEESAAATSPSKCTEFQTLAFNEQETGGSGKEANELCEEQAEEQSEPIESVAVSKISVEGEKATAEAAITGSVLDGQALELELAEESGEWKLNHFLAFTKYDGKKLGENFETALETAGEVEPSVVKCLAEGVTELSEEQAEELAFESNVEALEELGCEE